MIVSRSDPEQTEPRLTRPTSPAAVDPRPLISPSFVGREKELDQLTEVLLSRPAIGVVEGEAGVGKTRLVRELLRNHKGLALLGYCHPMREPFPLGPFAEALGGAADAFANVIFSPASGAASRLLPELAHLLPGAPEGGDDPRAERHVLLRSLVALLNDLGPTLLVLEDLHWADDATLELLALLQARFPEGLVLVGTFRREDTSAGSPVRTLSSRLSEGVTGVNIELSPLDITDVRNLVSFMLATDQVSDEFAAYLHERTAGVPFAVEEVVRLLHDRHDIVRYQGQWARRELEDLEIPGSLAESVVQRLVRLPRNARAFTEAAAILGTPSTERLIARVAELSPEVVSVAASKALSAALLQESGGKLDFRHPLAREAIAASVLPPKRRELHDRAARHLARSRPKPLTRLAHHHREAGNERQWLHCAEAAADFADSLGDDSESYRLLRDVVRSPLLKGTSRARVAAKLGRAAYQSGAYEEAAPLMRAVLEEETLAPNERGEIRLLLGQLRSYLGDMDSVKGEFIAAAEELEGRPELQARALAALSIPEFSETHVSEHLAWGRRAVELLPQVDDSILRMAVSANWATLLLAVGEPSARATAERIPHGHTVGEKKERIRSSFNILNTAAAVGHLSESRVLLDEAMALSRELDYDRLSGDLQDLECFHDWMMGRWDGLEERCRRVCEAAGHAAPAFSAEIVLGCLQLSRGAIEVAEVQMRRAVQLAWERTAAGDHPWAAAVLSRVLLARGEAAAAAAESLQAFEAQVKRGMWSRAAILAPTVAQSLIASGEEETAAYWVQGCSKNLKGLDLPRASASLMMAQGVVASARSHERAAVWFERATTAWAGVPSVYETAMACESTGVSHLRGGRSGGRKHLERALDEYERLGATWDANRVRRHLRAHGVTLVHRRGRKGYGLELSPREAEVARLAAEGLANREIAEKLFLSSSTVKHHLGGAMRKLGVASRGQLGGVIS